MPGSPISSALSPRTTGALQILLTTDNAKPTASSDGPTTAHDSDFPSAHTTRQSIFSVRSTNINNTLTVTETDVTITAVSRHHVGTGADEEVWQG